MRLRAALVTVLLGSLLAFGNAAIGQGTDKAKAGKQDLEMLQGEWKLVRCETDGSRLDIGAARLVIKQTGYVLHIGPGTDKGTFSLNSLAKPKRWDATSEGQKGAVLAVYELNGNRLRFAYRQDNKRPSSIFGKRGSDEGHVLYVFERGDGKPERPDDPPKKAIPQIVITAETTPFRKELKLAQGDSRQVLLPNGKQVTLWVGKDRLGLGKTKSGLYCEWEKEAHIEQGSVIYGGKTVEHELFVADWKLSYLNDLESSPLLNVTVIVTRRQKK
jgi:uncharacterized protein (TIGR03067 family)